MSGKKDRQNPQIYCNIHLEKKKETKLCIAFIPSVSFISSKGKLANDRLWIMYPWGKFVSKHEQLVPGLCLGGCAGYFIKISFYWDNHIKEFLWRNSRWEYLYFASTPTPLMQWQWNAEINLSPSSLPCPVLCLSPLQSLTEMIWSFVFLAAPDWLGQLNAGLFCHSMEAGQRKGTG